MPAMTGAHSLLLPILASQLFSFSAFLEDMSAFPCLASSTGRETENDALKNQKPASIEIHLHRSRVPARKSTLWKMVVRANLELPPANPFTKQMPMPSDDLPIFAPNELCRPSVEKLAAALPPEDAALDALIEDAARRNDLLTFFPVMLAATFAERSLDARILVQGTPLLESATWLACVAWRMQGDVSGCLIESAECRVMRRELSAAALLIAAKWNEEHGLELAPPRLLACARGFARHEQKDEPGEGYIEDEKQISYLWALCDLVKDDGLRTLMEGTTRKKESDLQSKIIDLGKARANVLFEMARLPFKELFPEKPEPPKSTIAQGRTVRRAAARVGRNEPCPCGSGKKYKRCCSEKDAARLREPTHVAGKTLTELRDEPEAYLTPQTIAHIKLEQWPRIDPLKVPSHMFPEYLKYLGALRFFDRAVEAIRMVGYKPELENAWEDLMGFACLHREAAAVRKLAEIRTDQKVVNLSLAGNLLYFDNEPAEKLRVLEEMSLELLKDSNPGNLNGVAQSLLASKLPGLGILIARGVIPLLPTEDAAQIFQQILEARDRLNLSPDDPFSDIIDAQLLQRRDSEPDENDAAALRQARRNLEKKAAEVRELKEALANAQRDLDLRERREKRAAAEASPASEDEKKETGALRARLDKMKTALKQTHTERNDFRRELEQAHAEMEKMRAEQPVTPDTDERDREEREESLLLPPEPTSNQPVRLLEFPKKFDEMLHGVPRHIARNTMVTLGQIAGGEPAGFVGARRLNVCEDITRQRIGGDYRLLYRLLPDRVQVVTLINRRDLDRTIKSLV
jgi:mRNA-degrading endonuclease RelE of RelBE toxin-antitoxin system